VSVIYERVRILFVLFVCVAGKAVGMPVAIKAVGITTATCFTRKMPDELAVRLGCTHSLVVRGNLANLEGQG
jgi:hypothetical protein